MVEIKTIEEKSKVFFDAELKKYINDDWEVLGITHIYSDDSLTNFIGMATLKREIVNVIPKY